MMAKSDPDHTRVKLSQDHSAPLCSGYFWKPLVLSGLKPIVRSFEDSLMCDAVAAKGIFLELHYVPRSSLLSKLFEDGLEGWIGNWLRRFSITQQCAKEGQLISSSLPKDRGIQQSTALPPFSTSTLYHSSARHSSNVPMASRCATLARLC